MSWIWLLRSIGIPNLRFPMTVGERNWFWVTGPGGEDSRDERVPLVVAPHGCVYRYRMLKALDSKMIPWRIVYTGTSYGGISAAVQAGLGVTVLAGNTVPADLAQHSATDRLPALEDARVDLHYQRDQADPAVIQLARYIADVNRKMNRMGVV